MNEIKNIKFFFANSVRQYYRRLNICGKFILYFGLLTKVFINFHFCLQKQLMIATKIEQLIDNLFLFFYEI